MRNSMSNFYCEYCGQKFPNVQVLTINKCMRHPEGSLKGNHKLYEGSEKSQYTCKFCGRKFPTIANLVVQPCMRHPNGSLKGKHAPAL